MEAPAIPPDEAERLDALHELAVLDTPPEERYDRLTRLAARLFDVPMALVSLVDADRQWFKSRVGIADRQTARRDSFCAHAVAGSVDDAGQLVVADAALDHRFADNPFVVGDPHVRFYAGRPLHDPTGHAVGTLCVLDRTPRHFGPDDAQLLADLANLVEQELHSVELAQAVTSLRTSQRLLEASFEHAPNGIALIGLQGEQRGRLLRVNRALCRLLRTDPDRLVGSTVAELGRPDDFGPEIDAAERLSSAGPTAQVDHHRDKRQLRGDGTEIWVRVSVAMLYDDAGRPDQMLAHIEDIDEAHANQERLAHTATHDPLTGLPNRTLLMDRLQQAAEGLTRSGRQLAVIFLDCDRFKEVNDELGHAAGDVYLVELADRLRTEIRGTDTAARLGGDEFVVLLPDLIGATEAVTICERLRRALELPVRWSGGEIPVSVSGGIATLASGDLDPRAVLRRADEALYRAKQAGRGRFVLADPA